MWPARNQRRFFLNFGPPKKVQQQIIEKDLSGNPRNPSAVLLSRIRAVEASLGVPMGQPPPPAGTAGWEGWHDGRRNVLAQVEDFIRQYGLDDKAGELIVCEIFRELFHF